MGNLALHVATDRLTATRQLSCLPNCPQYWCATPTECFPFFGNPVSPTIQATTGPCFCMAGSTSVRTCCSSAWSLHGALATRWVQTLAHRLDALRSQTRRHRLDDLAFTW